MAADDAKSRLKPIADKLTEELNMDDAEAWHARWAIAQLTRMAE
jgi:hypothetical protein